MTRPNIIYIHSHDTGRYVQPYGHAIPTPNIQKLAEDGVLFRKAFCAAPTCSPSRACLLTGQWAHCNGMIGLAHRGSRLHDYNHLLSHTLKANGYDTVLGGVQHVAPSDMKDQLGYDQVLTSLEPKGDPQEASAQTAAAFIADRTGNDAPFFLDIGFIATHRTNKGQQRRQEQWFNGEDSPIGDPRYCLPPATLPDTPQTRRDIADFKLAARRLDHYMGIVFRAVDQAGLRDNTLIICTTDHGVPFPGMKCNLTDHGMGVMLIMRGPSHAAPEERSDEGAGIPHATPEQRSDEGAGLGAGFTGGRALDAMVSQIDLFPTICDVVGIDRPDWLQGKSMVPLVRDGVEQINEQVFAEVSYHAAYEPKRCVRTQRYKYIRRWENPGKQHPGPVLPNYDDSVSKSLWLEHGWADRVPDAEQLYDLIFDPNETNNLVIGDRAPEVLDEMRDRLDRWMRRTDDPLLEGFIEPWPHMKINDPDGVSPQDDTTSATAAVTV